MSEDILRGLLDASLRSVAMAVVVGLVLVLARGRVNGMRHAMWTTVLVAMILMPVVSRVVPAIPLPLTTSSPSAPSVFRATPAAVEASSVATALPVTTGEGLSAPSATLRTSSVASSTPAMTPLPWSMVLLTLYICGVAILLGRVLVAIRIVGRLVSRSRPIADLSTTAWVSESPAVASPLTVGVVSPRVLLPESWRTWSSEKTAAVLAHEQAHIDRRDPLVLCLARLNCCVFWFNPLAWWLERKLATTAEHAADDVAVGKVGDARSYAEVLLDIAQTVRRKGGRLAWHGVGVDGTGLLGARIDRVLADERVQAMSPFKKVSVGVSCAIVVALAVACRERAPSELTPDPELAAELEQRKASNAAWEASRALTPEQVSNLEKALATNPEDLVAREKLLTYYFWTGDNKQPWAQNLVARRPHALWLIEHHPDSEFMWRALLSKAADPEGYARARSLWMAETTKADVTSQVLGNAADFFRESEKPVAEAMLLRARAMDPDGPLPRTKDLVYYPPWGSRLGVLYAQGLLGAVGSTLGNVVHRTDLREAHGAYANEVRAKLAGSQDVVVLVAAGSYLARNASEARLDFDHVALGRSYLERALQLDPSARTARSVLAWLDHVALRNRLRGVEVAALSEADRFVYFPDLAEEAYMRSEWADTSQAASGLAQSEQYARDVLALAPKFTSDPAYGTTVYRAHVALATNAIRGGDKATALAHLREATSLPVGEPRQMSLDNRVVNALLDSGERESVAQFLERSADRWVPGERDRRLKDAALIRAGRMPMAYQYAKTTR